MTDSSGNDHKAEDHQALVDSYRVLIEKATVSVRDPRNAGRPIAAFSDSLARTFTTEAEAALEPLLQHVVVKLG
jgi:hypothetical protein